MKKRAGLGDSALRWMCGASMDGSIDTPFYFLWKLQVQIVLCTPIHLWIRHGILTCMLHYSFIWPVLLITSGPRIPQLVVKYEANRRTKAVAVCSSKAKGALSLLTQAVDSVCVRTLFSTCSEKKGALSCLYVEIFWMKPVHCSSYWCHQYSYRRLESLIRIYSPAYIA